MLFLNVKDPADRPDLHGLKTVYSAASRICLSGRASKEDYFFRKKIVPITIGIAKKANPRAIGTWAPMEIANIGSRPGMEP